MQKINLITHFFQRYRKEITNLLFWVIWAYLAAHTKNDSINLKKPFTFICRQRINFILHLCLKILQRYRKLVMLDIWACLGTHKWYYELVEHFRVYLLAKNQLHSPQFSGDTAKTCKLLILGTLGMPGYAHPKR